MKKKLFILTLCLLLFFCTTPVFAETEQNGSESTEITQTEVQGESPDGETGEQGDSGQTKPEEEVEEPETEEGEQPEQTEEPEQGEEIDGETGEQGDSGEEYLTKNDILTVNISDESVQAIANAVSEITIPASDTCTLSVVTNDGNTYWVPQHFENYPYIFIWQIGTSNYSVCALPDLFVDDLGHYRSTYYISARITGGIANFTEGAVAKLSKEGTTEGTQWRSNWYSAAKLKASNFDTDLWSANVKSIGTDPVFTVSFDTGFDDLTVEQQTVTNSSSVILPSVEYEGYQFSGWFLDEDCTEGNQFTSDYNLVKNITLYAKWEKYKTVSFVTGFEEDLENPLVVDSLQFLFEYGSLPEVERAGYDFLGWYTDDTYTIKIDKGDLIIEDTILYAKFVEGLQFDTKGLIYVTISNSVLMFVILLWLIFFRR